MVMDGSRKIIRGRITHIMAAGVTVILSLIIFLVPYKDVGPLGRRLCGLLNTSVHA